MSPDAEALRQAALRSSWARDQRVARRRLALRWLAWAFWRYGLAILLVVAVAASVVAWMLSISHTSQRSPRFTVVPAQHAASAAPLMPSENTPPIRQEP